MSVIDWLLGSAEPTQPTEIIKSPPVRYSSGEMMGLAYGQALYPKEYSYIDGELPVAATAYQPATFQKSQEIFESDDGQEEWEKFLKRNEQRMSPEDLDAKIMGEMLGLRSALIAEANEGQRNVLRTGPNVNSEEYGATRIDKPRFWASTARFREGHPGMPTITHEGIHQYLIDVLNSGEELPEDVRMLISSGIGQHALIDLLDQRLQQYDSPNYATMASDIPVLDWLEKRAEKRLGEKYSEKNQGRISSR